jgi:hypothetical protein
MKPKTQDFLFQLTLIFCALCIFVTLAFVEYKLYRLGFADGYNYCMMQPDGGVYEDRKEGEQE